MKVQTTVLFLCFLSGVFLSSVVHAKPSPALMKELIALEKYLEKKQGSDGADGQNENQNENPTGDNDNELNNLLNNAEQKNDNKDEKPTDNNENPTIANGEMADNKQGQPVNGNGGTVGDETSNGNQGASQVEGSTPETQDESVSPENAVSAPSDGKEGEKPQEGNGQVENGRDQTFAFLDDVIRKFKAALAILDDLGDLFRTQFQDDDRRFKEFEDKVKETKEKTKENISQLKTAVQNIESELTSAEKKSVQENAPAKRSHLSDTEFLNIVHSLLTNN